MCLHNHAARNAAERWQEAVLYQTGGGVPVIDWFIHSGHYKNQLLNLAMGVYYYSGHYINGFGEQI